MKKKFFSGDSVRQALLQAARYFQVEPEEVAYREVDRRHGFLRGRRRAVIEVDTENPIRSAAAVEDESGAVSETVERPEAEPPVADTTSESMTEETPTVSFEERPTEALSLAMMEELTRSARESARETPGISAPTPAEPPPASPAETAAESAPPRAVDESVVDAARQALGRIFELGRLDLEIEKIEQGEEKLEIELRGADEEYLLEDRGRLLLAIQHLMPRMLRGLTGKSTPCQVDCDDFHEIRTEQLRDLAQRVASEVRNRRRSRTLEPMSPDERRIVHLTLADDPAVETVSQGNGLFKRVQIRPQKMRPRDFDPFGRE